MPHYVSRDVGIPQRYHWQLAAPGCGLTGGRDTGPDTRWGQYLVSNLTRNSTSWPDHPAGVQVYAGETHYDQYEPDPTKAPPLS